MKLRACVLRVLSHDEPELLHVAEDLLTVLNGTTLIWRCPLPPPTLPPHSVIHTFRPKFSLGTSSCSSLVINFLKHWNKCFKWVQETLHLHFTSHSVQHGFESWHRSERTVSADWNGSDDLVTPSTSATWRRCYRQLIIFEVGSGLTLFLSICNLTRG